MKNNLFHSSFHLVVLTLFSLLLGQSFSSVNAQENTNFDPHFQIPEPDPPTFIPPSPPSLTIKAVGDTILGTNFPQNDLPPQPQELFTQVQSLLTGADLLFGNFESTITDYPHSAKRPVAGRVYAFRSPPSHAAVLGNAGFNVMSVANNHSHDFKVQGFQDTIRNLESAGVRAVGQKGQITYTEVEGLTVAWIGFSYLGYHNFMNNLNEATALVRQADQKADIIIISVHAGAEGSNALRVRNQTETYLGENRGNMVQFSRTMINQGADLILGHGPHVPRAVELYQNRLVVYSLANFIGYRTLSTRGVKGDSLVLEVELDEEGNFLEGQIHPLRLSPTGIPAPDPQKRTIQLMRQLTSSDFPNTPLVIDAQGKISPVSR